MERPSLKKQKQNKVKKKKVGMCMGRGVGWAGGGSRNSIALTSESGGKVIWSSKQKPQCISSERKDNSVIEIRRCDVGILEHPVNVHQ